MRRLIILAGVLALGCATIGGAVVGGAAVAQTGLADDRERLIVARESARAAGELAAQLEAAAAGERDAAARARAREAAVAARVEAAKDELEVATARVAVVAQLLRDQRATLGEAQTPVARLLAALTSLARRPAVVALAQPGSVDDMVHVRAVLGSALPVVRARTAEARSAVERTAALQASAALAATALQQSRVRLEAERTALAQLEASHRARATTLGHDALSESDRALALGEQARDLVDQLGEAGAAQATAAELSALPAPLPRPLAPDATLPDLPNGVYRLPVEGKPVTGFGELAPAGYRARGITLVCEAGARVVAPAGGVVRYAGPFRRYGTIVVIDHGGGWSSLIVGLDAAAVRVGEAVSAGTHLGDASRGDQPRITVELRRRGVPIDPAELVG